MGLFSKPEEKKYLGIDIGGSSVKMVELSNVKGRAQLETYGFLERSIKVVGENLLDKPDEMAEAIKRVAERAKVTSRDAVAALPASAVFNTILNLTGLTKRDLAAMKRVTSAVEGEAHKVLPMPLEDMVLDWKIINGQTGTEKPDDKVKNVQILLNAAAKSLVKKYIEIFKQAGFNLLSLETEAFGMSRSLVGKDTGTVLVVDIGAANTDIFIMDKMIPVLTRTVDTGGYKITKAFSDTLGITLEQAEQFKRDLESYRERLPDGKLVPDLVDLILTPIVKEVKYLIEFFGQQSGNEGKKIERIILSGGTAKIFNLPEYFTGIFNIRTFLGNPWARIIYPEELRPALDNCGSRLAVAIGLALREIDK